MGVKHILDTKNAAKRITENAKSLGQQLGETAMNIGEKAGEFSKDAHEHVKSKYDKFMINQLNPVFEENIAAPDFIMPKLIHVVDYDKKHDNELCEGAIGWIDNQKDVETLHIYHSALEKLGLNFMPFAFADVR